MASPIRCAHLFVDEVQDASPVELRVLLDLTGTDRCVTLAGDVAQRMRSTTRATTIAASSTGTRSLDGLGVPHTKIEPLKVSYRSTAEITTFARAVLGPLAHDAVRSPSRRATGRPSSSSRSRRPAKPSRSWPRCCKRSRARRAVRQRRAHRAVPAAGRRVLRGSLARRGAERAARREAGLHLGGRGRRDRRTPDQGPRVRRGRAPRDDGRELPGQRSPARHALYVGATRAAHQLWCVASEKPSSLVQAALRA